MRSDGLMVCSWLEKSLVSNWTLVAFLKSESNWSSLVVAICVDGLAYHHTRVVLLFVFDVVLAPLTVAAAQSKTMTMAHERGRIIIRRQIHRASK